MLSDPTNLQNKHHLIPSISLKNSRSDSDSENHPIAYTPVNNIGQMGVSQSRRKQKLLINVNNVVLDLVSTNQYRIPPTDAKFAQVTAHCTMTEALRLPKNMHLADDFCKFKAFIKKLLPNFDLEQ